MRNHRTPIVRNCTCITAIFAMLMAFSSAPARADEPIDPALLTVAESTDYKGTATSQQVLDLLAELDTRSDLMSLMDIGNTFEGKPIRMAIIADPPLTTPEEAKASGKLISLVWANIHAGEVCGKEALLMLAREITATPNHPLLDDHVLLLIPNYNADGNDMMSPDNRRGQVGPELGMGRRRNAMNLDLNRDWLKAEAPETRAMIGVMQAWDPHFTVDCHTTNGSYHQLALTYDGPANPSTHPPLMQFVMDDMFPAVTERLLERTGYNTFFYGNFNRAHTHWSTYSAAPRFSTPYAGLRHCASVLSEAHAYETYKNRIMATREFVRELLRYTAERRDDLKRIHDEARAQTIARGENPQPDDMVSIRSTVAPHTNMVTIPGFVMKPSERGRMKPMKELKDHRVIHMGRYETVLSVRRPYAYIITPECAVAVDQLRLHGVEVEAYAGTAVVEAYTIANFERSEREYQGHHMVQVDTMTSVKRVTFPAGSWIVRTGQPLGTLLVHIMEPEAADSLAVWNFLDDFISDGAELPCYRVRSKADLAK